MWNDTKVVLRDLGKVLHVPGFMAIVSIVACFLFDERYALVPLLVTAAISFGLGQLLFRAFRHAQDLRLSHGMVIAAIGWLIVPVIGALPIYWIARQLAADPATPDTVRHFTAPLNAAFESFSGFTGTGLTVALRPSELPPILQWWRSFTEWVGGVGVIVMMLSIVAPDAGVFRLYFSEGREEKILPTVKSTVRTIWWIYLLFTVVAVLLLAASGMTWWQALNHGMTGIATGGFGTTDHSLADFGPLVRSVMMVVMIAGAISFAVHYQVVRYGRIGALWGDSQHRALWLLLVVGAVALCAERFATARHPSVLNGIFEWVSALTTCGFQTDDLHEWSRGGQLLLASAMLVGGASGSTVGGIKLIRLVLLSKGVYWRFMRIRTQPHELLHYELDGRVLSELEAVRQVEAAGVLALLWGAVLWAGVFVLVHVAPEGFSLSDIVLEMASAQGNVGLSTGLTSPALHPLGRVTLIAVMWVGRLEIIPVFIMLTGLYDQIFHRRHRLEP